MEHQIDRSGAGNGVSGTRPVTYTPTPNSAKAHDKVYELRLPECVTISWLVRQGVARRTAYRVMGKPMRIDLATLSKLCQVLDCEPGDILIDGGNLR